MISKIQYLTRHLKKDAKQSAPASPLQQNVTINRERMVTVQMRLATFGVLCISFVLGVIWIFFFGILIGRGYAPEEHVPQLRQILPEAPAVQVDGLVVIDNSGVTAIRQNAPVTPVANNTSADSGASDARTAAPQTIGPTPPATGVSNIRPTTPTASSTRRAAEQAVAAQRQTATPPQRGQQQQTVRQETAVNTPAQSQATFKYQFQVAAFKVKDQAEAMQNKLKQDKLTAKVVTSTTAQGVTWHRVVILFSGTEKDVEALREQLKKHKITTLIRQEKTQL